MIEEAQGFRALLNLEEPKYSIEQIAGKTGKSPAYVAQRLKLTELAPAVVEVFSKDEIGVRHALLLAKLQPSEPEGALAACFREDYCGGKSRKIVLPVRTLKEWIEHNVMLALGSAPFSKDDGELLPRREAVSTAPSAPDTTGCFSPMCGRTLAPTRPAMWPS